MHCSMLYKRSGQQRISTGFERITEFQNTFHWSNFTLPGKADVKAFTIVRFKAKKWWKEGVDDEVDADIEHSEKDKNREDSGSDDT